MDRLSLADLMSGEKGIITKVVGQGAFRKRIVEMGFVKGKVVRVIKNAPLQDPVEYEIMGYNVSLRRSEAALIEVIKGIETDHDGQQSFKGTWSDELIRNTAKEKSNTINIALVGNPNSGKTTLFNQASSSHERVGNYGGVTIDIKEASVRHGDYTLKITDMPGTYSISEYSPEELFVRKHLAESLPDLVINVIDASNLERNLFLTTQLIDMNIRVIIALNMFDEFERTGLKLDHKELGRMLGIPIVPTVGIKGYGLTDLFDKAIEVYEGRDPDVRHIHINYGIMLEESIAAIQAVILKNEEIADRFSTRYLAIKLLENDKAALNQLRSCENYGAIHNRMITEVNRLEKEYGEKSETVITDIKYGFISGALKETLVSYPDEAKAEKRDFDFLLTHKIWGFPIFFFFMWLMFQTTFTVGSLPMRWIQDGVAFVSDLVRTSMSEGPLRDLLTDGIIGGVGGVIVFLPNILILFFFISLMEDTGYMARVSFITDKLMHRIGLHGKSFIPLLMGFGCNVPAIMATRTLDNRKDRIMTMLIIPFMSCSARLPVYILIISAFFSDYQGLVLFSVYLIGIIIAVLVAFILKNTLFSKQDVPFVMELPPYRIPTLKNTTRHMWFKGSQYIRKMGTVILFASILIWALGYYPRKVDYTVNYASLISDINNNPAVSESVKASEKADIEVKMMSEHQEKSYIGRIGRFIEPALLPLGFDWKIGISLLSGLAAKEVVVSTMGVLYQADIKSDEHATGLPDKLQAQVHTSGRLMGKKVFTPLVAFGFMLFILIYFPCVAVIAAIRKEADWKWALFTMVYTTAIAWTVAFMTFQIGSIVN